MNKFSVGDKVVRLQGGNTPKFLALQGAKDYYTVTSASQTGYWLGLDNVVYRKDHIPWNWANFALYEGPGDDELPPAPVSVMYFNSVRSEGNDQRLVVEMASQHDGWSEEATSHIGLKVVPKTGSTRADGAIGINLTPDSALQLAHDLRRMAMEIKRQEKQNV